MKKKYFPKKFKSSKVNNLPRKPSSQKKYKSLRDEFDIMIRKKHKLLSDEQLDRLWLTIGTQLSQAPNKSLTELIDTLEDIS